jgi:hypothetical protein
MEKTMPANFNKRYTQCQFYALELPFILMMILLGLIFEFLVELPFSILCSLDRRTKRSENTAGKKSRYKE